jgi:hypothetical protein
VSPRGSATAVREQFSVDGAQCANHPTHRSAVGLAIKGLTFVRGSTVLPVRRGDRLAPDGRVAGYNMFRRSQVIAVSATSRHPWSMVSECARSGNSVISVIASEWRYCRSVAFVTDSGTV